MSNVFYWLQFKFELGFLKYYLKGSQCKGLYLPVEFFNNEKDKLAIKETIQILKKEVFLNFNYKSNRPSLLSDEILKDVKKIKKKKEKYEFLKKLCQINEAKKFVKEKYSIYLEIISFLKEKKTLTVLERFIFDSIEETIDICEFEFPYIPLPSINKKKNNKEVKDLYELVSKVNQNFMKIQSEDKKYKNSIFNVILSKKELKQNSPTFSQILKDIPKTNLALWIIDFNEMYSTKSEIILLINFVKILHENCTNLIIKYIGIYSRYKLNIKPKTNYVIRLNGYPGQNINIGALIKRTRRVVDPITGLFLSLANIGERFDDKYECECKICTKLNIDTYSKALNIYLFENPEDLDYYKQFIGEAQKTKHQKIRKIQNRNILEHNFFNLDLNLELTQEDFKTKFENVSIFKKWDSFNNEEE